jgi:hypothetical protein
VEDTIISTTVANSPLFWLAIIGGLAALYLLSVGWPAALLLACMMPRREPPAPSYYYPGGCGC